jgi:hypothetical protein
MRFLSFGRRLLLLSSLGVTSLASTAKTQTAVPIPKYSLTAIPSQKAFYGQSLEFYVESEGGDPISLSVPSQVRGQLKLDAADSKFSYIPAVDDLRSFVVVFSSGTGAGQVQRKVRISPQVRSANTFFPSEAAEPDSESTDYIEVSVGHLPNKRLFNASPEEVEVRKITVAAHDLVIKEGYGKNNIFELLDEQPSKKKGDVHDLAEVNISADTLTIGSFLYLPQAQVTIRAKHLRFENDGAIVTMPSSAWFVAKAATDEHPVPDHGRDGEPGGNITVFVSDFSSDDPALPRFITIGGDGQAGGKGRNGVDGISYDEIDHNWSAGTIYVDNNGDIRGVEKWPGNGTDATLAGWPGKGGIGGNLLSNIDLAPYLNARGGSTGPMGPAYHGGSAGKPQDSNMITIRHHRSCSGARENRRCDDWDDVSKPTHHSEPGQDAFVSTIPAPPSKSGQFVMLQNRGSAWIDPISLSKTLSYAEDLYLNGFIEEADDQLSAYSDVMTPEFLTTVPPDDQVRLYQQQLQIQNLRQRISANLDYFGYSAGYVPLLSFEANLTAYENELKSAIPLLYVSYWLSAKERDLAAKRSALNVSIDSLSKTLRSDMQAYAEFESSIGDIQNQATKASIQLGVVQAELKSEDDHLRNIATANVQRANEVTGLRKVIGTLSLLSKVVPIYQPALGIVGQGLDTLSHIDQGDFLSNVASIASVPDQLTSDVLKQSAAQADKQLKQLDPSQASNAKQYVTSLVPVAQKVAEAQKKLADLNRTVQAPQSEVEAELARLRSEDPQYQKFIDDVASLQTTSAALAQKANSTLQQADSKFESAVTEVGSLSALNTELSSAILDLDPVTQSYLEEMTRRAKDRLLKYHYYFAKAYEYRTLQRYPHNLRQDVNFERLVKIASTDTDLDAKSHDVRLSQTEFDMLKAAYEAPLADTVQQIITAYNNSKPQQSDKLSYSLTSSERQTLNETGTVVIDLQRAGMIRGTEENQRIVSITASNFLAEVTNGNVANATVKVTYEHPAVSLIGFHDQIYVFRHPDSFFWGTTRDLASKENSEVEVGPGTNSLLYTILKRLQYSDQQMQLFSEPSLLGPIVVSRTVLPDVQPPTVKVTELKLKIRYEYNQKSSQVKTLTLEPPPGMAPFFQIDTTDLSGLNSGRGNITRSYTSTSAAISVKISAPQTYGNFRFSEWAEGGQWINGKLQGGKTLDKNRETVIPLKANRTIQAVYVLPQP